MESGDRIGAGKRRQEREMLEANWGRCSKPRTQLSDLPLTEPFRMLIYS